MIDLILKARFVLCVPTVQRVCVCVCGLVWVCFRERPVESFGLHIGCNDKGKEKRTTEMSALD